MGNDVEHPVKLSAVAAVFVAILALGTLLPANGQDGLAFESGENGVYTFDTGVLRGTLRQGGKSLGLSPLTHVPSGTRLDRSVGICSFYRLFTTNRRYWTAGWDWPSTSVLLPDGAVRITWPVTKERPFELSGVYRWSDTQTLDVTTIVKAVQDLDNFEVFLASYFEESFPSPYVYVRANPPADGKPGFMLARRSYGDWQMFPRDDAALALIHDGRWTKEPHPVNWVVMPHLAAPVCVRRGGDTDLTMILMAPSTDCFAIATPYAGEGHYSLYLSLFGWDVKAGETAVARTRLVLTSASSDAQVLALYEQYTNWLETLQP